MWSGETSGEKSETGKGDVSTRGASEIRREDVSTRCSGRAIVAVFSTGAYNASMSSNYNRIPRPAAVVVKGGSSELVQKREQPDDLLRYDVLPERFRELL